MKTNQNQNNDELRFENEFRKLKISLESGAEFHSVNDGEPELPPEVEKQFLDNIEAFEKAWKNAEELTVYEFLNRPEFLPEENLSDEQLASEMTKLNDLMADYCMAVDTIYEVDDRTLYKFITEKLIHVETSNVKIPQFTKHFIYEEFVPNHEEDIKSMCIYLMNYFVEDKLDSKYTFLAKGCADNFAELQLFRNSFLRLNDFGFELESLNICGHMATAIYKISFNGVVSDNTLPVPYFGQGVFKVEFVGDCDVWCFESIKIPGMRSEN